MSRNRRYPPEVRERAVACYRGTAIEAAEGLALGAPGAGPP